MTSRHRFSSEGIEGVTKMSLARDIASALLLLLTLSVILILLLMTFASSAPICLTFEQARHLWPKEHLWWYSKDHCWSNRRGGPPSKLRIDPMPADYKKATQLSELNSRRWYPRQFDSAAPLEPPVMFEPSTGPEECCWPDVSLFDLRWGKLPVDQ